VHRHDSPPPAAGNAAAAAPGHCCRLSEEIEAIVALASGSTVAARVLVERLGVRGHALLAFFLSLPFLQPVPLLGLSTPVGTAIAILGVLMALDRPPWLPRRFLDRELPAHVVIRIARAGQGLLRRAERFIKPRGQWFHRHPSARPIAGVVIMVSGLELALPLPIAFTNSLPAIVILSTAVGLIEEDAAFTVAGMVGFVVLLALFGGLLVLPFLGLRAIV
jgi:hypothetical protein